MNTTKLISHWTMDGSRYDVDSHVRATDHVGTASADSRATPEPTASQSSFLIKGANENGWQPLDV